MQQALPAHRTGREGMDTFPPDLPHDIMVLRLAVAAHLARWVPAASERV
jgi:hypothetical protein